MCGINWWGSRVLGRPFEIDEGFEVDLFVVYFITVIIWFGLLGFFLGGG